MLPLAVVAVLETPAATVGQPQQPPTHAVCPNCPAMQAIPAVQEVQAVQAALAVLQTILQQAHHVGSPYQQKVS